MSTPYSPQHRWMEWLVDMQVASRGCGSPVCLHTSWLGTAGWLFGGCKIHCRMMMYVASITRSQLANNSSVRGWKKWEYENLAVIYTVISTRSHDKKRQELFYVKMKKVRDENLVVVNFHEQYFLPLRYRILYSMYAGSVTKWFKLGCDASTFLFGKTQHPTTNNTHKNTNKTTSSTINNVQS